MNKRVRLLLAATIPFALALAGCGGQPKVRLSPLPAELTTCSDEPTAPELPLRPNLADPAFLGVQIERDRLTLDYVLAMRLAWGDCKAKVDGARAWNAKVANQ